MDYLPNSALDDMSPLALRFALTFLRATGWRPYEANR